MSTRRAINTTAAANQANANNGTNENKKEKAPKKSASILDLEKYLDKKVHVKFSGGREVFGILKGFDPLLNMVLDETKEVIRAESQDNSSSGKNTTQDKQRDLGLLVCRGPTVVLIHPVEEAIEISNPFIQLEMEQKI